MNKNNHGNSKISSFFKGKGFYGALCLSILMIGAASFFAYNRTADKLSDQLSSISGDTTSQTESNSDKDYKDVGGNQTSIPKIDSSITSEYDNEAEDAVKNIPAETEAVAETEPPGQETEASPVIMPVEGEVINPFSGSELVKSNTTGAWQTHNGVDIAANLGDEVKSMTSGTVTEVKDDGLWGVCVTIDHGSGMTAKYCNLNKGVNVQAGTVVGAGTVIGAIGDGCEIESADPSHLHFEVMKNGQYIDPIEFIKGTN